MRRLSVSLVLAASVVGVGVQLSGIAAFGPVKAVSAEERGAHTVANSGCMTTIDGKVIELQPGNGIKAGQGWRNCESYDGHSLIVYSDHPPPSLDSKAIE